MTLNLIIDENVLELSAKVQNDKGGLDVTCLGLLADIIRKCHYIHCTDSMLQTYRKKLKSMEVNMINSASTTMKILQHILFAGKLKVEPDPPKLSGENDIPSDDIYLIRLAVKTQSILVSTDLRLKKKLQDSGLMDKYKIKFNHPSEVK